jgi:hypothetical protein
MMRNRILNAVDARHLQEAVAEVNAMMSEDVLSADDVWSGLSVYVDIVLDSENSDDADREIALRELVREMNARTLACYTRAADVRDVRGLAGRWHIERRDGQGYLGARLTCEVSE